MAVAALYAIIGIAILVVSIRSWVEWIADTSGILSVYAYEHDEPTIPYGRSA